VPNFTAGTSFTDGVTNDVTAAKLNALVADAVPTSSLALASTTGTISNFTASTANITLGTIPTLTAGTTTGTAGIFTSGTIATALIPNGTFGTTTSTAATITNGTIPTLTAGTTTSTAEIVTSGTIATLRSTTGTITNLSTTLAGDFTISQGTGTLGTTGATLGTYGGATSVPVLAINAKGQVTSTGTAAITSGLTGFRNRIINGDMRIDQRNAGASVTISSVFHTDRWQAYEDSDGVMTAQQNSSAPTGFTNSLKITTTTADASLSALQFACVLQSLEGYNVSDFAFGTVSAQSITISFWVRSSLTGTFGGVVKNTGTGTRSYPFTYSISTADTWERKTVTISGDTTGTWSTDNSCGMQILFGLGVGSTYSGTAGAWSGSNLISATGAVSVLGTLNATWYITGVQLEAGSTATDFERRPIGTELALCHRYFETSYQNGTAVGTSDTSTCVGLYAEKENSTQWGYYVSWKTIKRSNPTATLYSATGASGNIRNISTSADLTANFASAITPNTVGGLIQVSVAGINAGNTLGFHWTAQSEL